MNILELLQNFDSKFEWEEPTYFDRESALQRAHECKKRIEIALDKELETEDPGGIQDCTFHAGIILLENATDSLLHPGQKLIHQIVLRFSNFGQFAAISEPEFIADSEVGAIQSILEEIGYVYIPPEFHSMPHKLADKRIQNGWVRFFDYL